MAAASSSESLISSKKHNLNKKSSGTRIELTKDQSIDEDLSDDYDEDYDDSDNDDSLTHRKCVNNLSTSIDCIKQDKTFDGEKLRNIERDNCILMNKIMKYTDFSKRKINYEYYRKPSSFKINTKKTQQKIDWENQILLKKIQNVKSCVKAGRL